jgi:hypothetical protein
MKPPGAGVDWIWLENSCRKLARPVEPPVIPKSAARVSKLDCKLLEVVAPLEPSALAAGSDAVESDSLRLPISLANCETGLTDVEEPSDWLLSDAIKLCMKACNAAAELDPELDVAEALEEVDVLESVLVSVEDALLDELEPASIDASAPNTAPSKPPPGGGGSGTLSVVSAASAAPALALLLPLRVWLANVPDSAVSG